MTPTLTGVYRSRQIVEDDRLQTLLNSLTLDQIRTALVNLAPTKKLSLKSHKDAEDTLLMTHRSLEDIQQVLLETEAEMPFKHCMFVRLSGANVRERVNSLGLDEAPQGVFGLRAVFVREFPSCISLTYEHPVSVREWYETSEENRKVRQNTVRHPIIVRLYIGQGIAAFFYPGFSQGNATKRENQINYRDVVADVMAQLRDKLGVSFIPLPTRECVKVFVEGTNARVRVVRSDADAGSGRVALTSAFQEKAVEEVLADYLAPHLDADLRSRIAVAARKALVTSTANSVVLFWFQEKIVTRLNFWDIGTEMLFVWHGVPSSYRIVEEIVGLFQTTFELLPQTPEQESSIRWITELTPGAVILPVHFAGQFHLDNEGARRELIQAMRIGLIQPVYRIRTNELLHETPNDWTQSLTSLNRVFHSDSGPIDGTNPQHIEVAFMRVDAGSVGA